MERIFSPAELEGVSPAPTGLRAGPFVFLSAQLPRDFSSGDLVRRFWDLPDDKVAQLSSGYEHEDGREGPVKAQTLTIYENLEKIIATLGLTLGDVVRQRIYVRNVRDIRAMQDMMLACYEGHRLPATTIVAMASNGVDHDVLVQVELILFDSGDSELESSVITLDGFDALTAPYPLAIKVGQLLFTSGLFGLNLESGRLAMRLDELEPDIRPHFDTGSYYRNASEEAYKAQIGTIHSHLSTLLASQGGSLEDLVKENHFGPYGVTEPGEGMHEWSAWHPMRLGLFQERPDRETVPSVTSPQTPQVGPDLQARTMVEAVALLPGPWKREGIVGEEMKMGHLKMLNWAGPLIFITGYIGMDRTIHGPIKKYHQLVDSDARLAGLTRLDNNESTLAQAWRTYGHIDRLLREGGLDFGSLVHQTVFMSNVSDYSIVEGVARSLGPIPATTVVGIRDCGPYPELEFEIDCMAFDERRL